MKPRCEFCASPDDITVWEPWFDPDEFPDLPDSLKGVMFGMCAKCEASYDAYTAAAAGIDNKRNP